MPFALVTIGLIMIVSGSRDTYAALGKELVDEFTGDGNFTYWLVSIGMLGALGAIPQFKAFSRAFMALAIIAMVIRNGGVFDKLTAALAQGPVHPGDTAKTVGASSTSNDFAATLETIRSAKPDGDNLAFGFKAGDGFGNFMKSIEIGSKFFI